MLKAEKFKKEIESFNYMFAVVENKVVKCADLDTCENCEFKTRCGGGKIKWLLEEYEEPNSILTEKEKIIINNILKAIEPFGAEVQCIAKYRQGDEPTDYYLNFSYKNSTDSFDTFTFNGNELFVGMEVDELYTLEELGL